LVAPSFQIAQRRISDLGKAGEPLAWLLLAGACSPTSPPPPPRQKLPSWRPLRSPLRWRRSKREKSRPLRWRASTRMLRPWLGRGWA